MNKALLVLAIAFAIPSLFLANGSATDLRRSINHNETSTAAKPTPGIILVTVQQSPREPNYFNTIDGQIRTTLGAGAASELRAFGLRKSRVIYRSNERCTYALSFDQTGKESEIIRYLVSQPGVVTARRDWPLSLLAEPNDYYYQPDSTDYSGHWVPSGVNYPNTDSIRLCKGAKAWTCCCEDPCGEMEYIPFGTLDSLHLSDQWYLQRVRANKAWDVEKGDPSVRIMVVDSGIDIEHPDLNGHIWDNSSVDPPGDADGDGIPDGSWGFADPVMNKDLDGDGLDLYGTDGECDCGDDGDYGFGPNARDDDPPGPGGGDDDPAGGTTAWDDNICGPGNQMNPLDSLFNDDMDDVQFMKNDDDGNGYPDDTYGVNLFDLIDDFGLNGIPDGLPGVKGWGTDDIDRDGGKHFNDPEVRVADFDGDGVPLSGLDGLCDAGEDGDYGFGQNARDDPPPGPLGYDDDDANGAWIDNLRGPGSSHSDSLPNFDDDMHDVNFMRYDNEEDGVPFGLPRDDSCPKAFACHGTEMAGIIGAETNNSEGVAGFTWNCTLVPAKVAIGYPEYEYTWKDTLHWNPQAAIERLMMALDYAIDKDVAVVNMSLGCYPNENNWSFNPLNVPELQAKINQAHNAGVVLIAGAGNIANPYCLYPASFNNVISVSGVNRHEKKATYTTYNNKVDVCAPVGDKNADMNTYFEPPKEDRGSDCMALAYYNNPANIFGDSTTLNEHGYATTAVQTSGATAQVSGLAALLASFYPKSRVQIMFPGAYSDAFYADYIEREIKRGCVALNDTFYTGGWLGSGRIDAYRSLTQWGSLTENVVWNDRMYISGDFEIPWDKTLTILPGTTVYVMPDDDLHAGDTSLVEFRVDGTLIAEGTSSEPIVFKSFSDSAGAGAWSGIQILGPGASASLTYCSIQNSYIGVKSLRPIEMSHCDLSNCEAHGIYLSGSGASGSQISNCTANGNGAIGIIGSSCDNLTISNCEANENFIGILLGSVSSGCIDHTFAECSQGDGILAIGCQSEFTCNYCYADGNGQQGMHLIDTRSAISNCRLNNNAANGLYCAGSSCSPDVNHCKIEQNQVGVRIASGGCPRLGDAELETGQNNSIFNQPIYVYGSPNYQLKAENNWWGNAAGMPPDSSKFIGLVDFVPYLNNDPVEYLAPMKPNLPASFSLAQNYPNPLPVSTPTMIRYSIPKGGKRATLMIYDVSGRRVRTIIDGATTSGDYSVMWDCRNDRGVKVVPGIYFCRLNVDGKSLTKKIVLVQK